MLNKQIQVQLNVKKPPLLRRDLIDNPALPGAVYITLFFYWYFTQRKEFWENIGRFCIKSSYVKIGATTETYLLSKQLVIHSETVESADIVPQLQVALPELLDVLAGFRQDSPFTLKREENNYFQLRKPMPFFFWFCPFGKCKLVL